MSHAAVFPGTKVLFETGKAEIPAVSAGDLKAVADYLAANKSAKVQLIGYVDSTGTPEVNKELAKQRAIAVRDALKAVGVAEDRVVLQKPGDIQAGQGEQARKVEVTPFCCGGRSGDRCGRTGGGRVGGASRGAQQG